MTVPRANRMIDRLPVRLLSATTSTNSSSSSSDTRGGASPASLASPSSQSSLARVVRLAAEEALGRPAGAVQRPPEAPRPRALRLGRRGRLQLVGDRLQRGGELLRRFPRVAAACRAPRRHRRASRNPTPSRRRLRRRDSSASDGSSNAVGGRIARVRWRRRRRGLLGCVGLLARGGGRLERIARPPVVRRAMATLDGRSHRHGAGLPLRYEWRRRRAFVEVRVAIGPRGQREQGISHSAASLALASRSSHVASEMERSRPPLDGWWALLSSASTSFSESRVSSLALRQSRLVFGLNASGYRAFLSCSPSPNAEPKNRLLCQRSGTSSSGQQPC